ncbi:MAG TPA: GNAT family N-acetyltransferase, partial [Chthoniobacterales bacterium]
MPRKENGAPFIRPARLEDAAEIAELSRQLGYPTTAGEMSGRLQRVLGGSDYLIAVAEAADGSLLGWVGAEYRILLEIGEEVEIVGLIVRQGARRLGVGRALLGSAEEFARSRGLNSIRVRSNVTRPESHPFYERMGYARVKTQHCYRKSVRPP